MALKVGCEKFYFRNNFKMSARKNLTHRHILLKLATFNFRFIRIFMPRINALAIVASALN